MDFAKKLWLLLNYIKSLVYFLCVQNSENNQSFEHCTVGKVNILGAKIFERIVTKIFHCAPDLDVSL